MKSILLVDDHSIVRSALALLLNDVADFQVVGEADNGLAAIEFIEDNPDTDIIIMDVRMPEMSGIEATKKITSLNKRVNILMLTMADSHEVIQQSFLAGAKAFISKSSSPEMMIEAIHTVSKGEFYINSEIAKAIIERFVLRDRANELFAKLKNEQMPEELFTERELEVLDLICEEYSTQDIADKLQCSKRTVEGHRNNMMIKAKAKNVVGLVMYAVNSGYLNRREKSKSPKDADHGEVSLK